MNTICLIDTSVLVEILKVPGKSDRHPETMESLKQKIQNDETLFLPMATILETGNHIAQNGDGNQRRQCAFRFVDMTRKALSGETPFTPISFLRKEELQKWLAEFPEFAMRGQGWGDLSIVHDWTRLCARHRGVRVYIWTFDIHLSSYNRSAMVL